MFNAMIPIDEAHFLSDDEIEEAVSAFLKACQVPFMLFPAPNVCMQPLKMIEMLRQLANPTIDTAAKLGAENVGAVVGRLQHIHDMVKGEPPSVILGLLAQMAIHLKTDIEKTMVPAPESLQIIEASSSQSGLCY